MDAEMGDGVSLSTPVGLALSFEEMSKGRCRSGRSGPGPPRCLCSVPRAAFHPRLGSRGLCLFLRPRCGLRFVTLRGRPAGDSIPGTDNSAELLISLLLFSSRAQWPLQRETAEGLCCPMTASTALSHCHHYPIRTCQLGNCSVAILKFFREVSLPLILDPSIPTQ